MARYSETARERELCRYYQPVEPPVAKENLAAKSSSDTAITAFAQLGALRLDAARCIISLVGKDREYVLAEASKTLSLQDDTRHDAGDQLWHGEGALHTRSAIGAILIRLLSEETHENPGGPITYVEVNDLREDERFSKLSLVTEAPFARYLICLPLRSARGYVIGLYILVDNKPRRNVSEGEMRFLEDMAITTMNHIEANRVKQRHDRAEKMVKAMALFLEGGESLREWWLNQATEGRNIQQSRINEDLRRGYSLSQQADAAYGVQDGPDQVQNSNMENIQNNHTFRLDTRRPSPVSFPSEQKSEVSETESVDFSATATTAASKTPTSLQPGTTISDNSSLGTNPTPTGTIASRQTFPPNPGMFEPDTSNTLGKELQDALLSTDVRKSFSRASNLVREATDLDGVAFFDASTGAFGAGTTRGSMNQTAPGEHTFDSVPDTTSSGSDTQQQHASEDDQRGSDSAPASVLAYSTRSRSSLRNHADSEALGSFSEKLVRILAKRYPHGKIFNFEDDGSISSSDIDGPEAADLDIEQTVELQARKAKKRLTREAEAAAILSVVPGARSIAWFPLWDSASERWYAGSLIWSLNPTRILIPEDELTYMAAWGNSVMAEVSRLSALVASRMKVDFVSSISHELRSPLHGILASVEFLQEEENMPPLHADMIDTIHSCGKTLLDTIDHVLDFAKLSKKKKPRSKKSKETLEKTAGKSRPRSPRHSQSTPTEDISDLSILTEEVIDSVYAGRNLSRASNLKNILQNSVVVIVDIAWQQEWTFKINVGAFRRVLMNIFSNALKYTAVGFVKVTVTLEGGNPTKEGKSQPILHLTVTDSGKGISQEFLRGHLYTAFKQEDALNVGTGLGLSIVRQVLRDVNGTIEIASEQSSGTKAMVSVPVRPTNRDPSSEEVNIVSEVRAKVKGKLACVVSQGFNIYPDMSDTPTGILSAEAEAMISLKSSLGSMITDWFGMEICSSSDLHYDGAEVFLALASDDLDEKIKSMDEGQSTPGNNSIVIVLCAPSYRGTNSTTSQGGRVFYLRLPAFPRKLAKVLHEAFCKSQPTRDAPSSEDPSISKSTTDPPAAQGIISAIKKPTRLPMGRRKSSKAQIPKLTPEDSSEEPLSPSTHLAPQTYRVLLVEDNEINLKLLKMHMTRLQQEYVGASNGREAFETYKSVGKFDIIFMDLQMPTMDGLEATREIRRYEHEMGLVPAAVVALTGAASISARQEAFSSGMDLFLTKPVAMKVLKDVLLELRDHGRAALREFG